MKLLSSIKQVLVGISLLIGISYAQVLIAQQNDRLVNYVYLGEFSKEQASLVLQKRPPLDTLKTKYSMILYKINYKTPAPNGEMSVVSGFVAMPASPKEPVAIVSYLHGTRVLRNDVPSRNNENNYIYPAIFGSCGGYMLAMPDYLGMGDNDLPVHPYVQAETLANTSIDMVTAAKELAKSLNYPVNDKLFIAGYSEGGFSTMVMYEELLKNHKDLPVTAVAPGSAPYDWYETSHFITEQPGPRATLYLAYYFYSMQTFKNYWTGLDEIFVEPYNTLIPILFDGTHQAQEILQALPLDPHQIFHASFLESVINGTDRNYEQLVNNFNHYDFQSTAPLLLVGTKGDHDVPYHGSEIAYQQLKSKSDKVYIKHVSEVFDHIEAFPYVLKEQLNFFRDNLAIERVATSVLTASKLRKITFKYNVFCYY